MTRNISRPGPAAPTSAGSPPAARSTRTRRRRKPSASPGVVAGFIGLLFLLTVTHPAEAETIYDSSLVLPDGRTFETWERPAEHTRTLHVAQRHEAANDENGGTEDAPFRTIQAAADAAQPGERVLIHAGVYRETVRPRRGGTGPDAMITYEAAPGEEVVITGAEAYTGPWNPQTRWNPGWKAEPREPKPEVSVYHLRLPAEWFVGYLPFGMVNVPQHHTVWGGEVKGFPDPLRWKLYLKRGLIFQDGRRLEQVSKPDQLDRKEGTYWPEENGLDVLVRPFGDAPADSAWEVTTREQAFAPEEKNLDYIRVKGLTMRHVADPWPLPQRAALSTSHGRFWVIENNHVHDVNGVGVDIGREHWGLAGREPQGHVVVRGNTIERAGILGLGGWAPEMRGLLVEDNLIEGCGWHDVERLWENAAIKLHHVKDSVLRRNLIRGTTNAASIWLDFGIENTRITGNVILDTTTGYGGVFIEAAKVGSVLIDHNVIGGSRMVAPLAAADGAEAVNGGHGVYAHDSDRLVVAHNLVFDCEGSGVHVALGQVDRIAITGRGAICRNNRVWNNVLVRGRRFVHFGRPHNFADGNLYVGREEPSAFVSRFQIGDPLENLDWETWREFLGFDPHGQRMGVNGPGAERTDGRLRVTLPAAPSLVPPLPRDLTALQLSGDDQRSRVLPGPFHDAAQWERPIDLDPRELD